MRCPKCGFISFDHLAACKKCNRSIDVVAQALKGSCSDVAVPVFLRLGPQPQEDPLGALSPRAQGSQDSTDLAMQPVIQLADDENVGQGIEFLSSPLDLGADAPEGLSLAKSAQDREITLDLDSGDKAFSLQAEQNQPPPPPPVANLEPELEHEMMTPGPAPEQSLTSAVAAPVRSFAEIDLTGLGPPEQPPGQGPLDNPLPAPEDGSPGAAVVLLEPLDLEALPPDFAGTILPPAGHRDARQAVKTGTVLDDFVLDPSRLGLGTSVSGREKRG